MADGSVTQQWRDTVPWAVLRGEIDLRVADQMNERELETYRTSGELVVDLGGVTFMDSIGLSMLLRFRQVADHVRLVDVPHQLAQLLDLTGVTDLFLHGPALHPAVD